MTLVEMIQDARMSRDLSQKEFAQALGFTPQYLCDLEKGRRLGSVEFVDRVCDWLGQGPICRMEWHRAGARSHGWDV